MVVTTPCTSHYHHIIVAQSHYHHAIITTIMLVTTISTSIASFCVILHKTIASGIEPTYLVGAARYDITGPAAGVNMVSIIRSK